MTTVVLLGAGASVDAGLPMSTDLTRRIADAVEMGGHPSELTRALHYVMGAILADRTARGGSAFESLNVEAVFSAVRMLADRTSSEAAPFAEWSPYLSSLGSQEPFVPAFFDRDLRLAIESAGAGALIARLMQLNNDRGGHDRTFEYLANVMLAALRDVLAIEDLTRVDYLQPLFGLHDGTARIATLNYDRSIEIAAQRAGLTVDDGTSRWRGSHDWTWETSSNVALLKLHGSIDWELKRTVGDAGMYEERLITGVSNRDEFRIRAPLGVVFGTQGKLRASGPFLAMLSALDRMLSDAHRLVVIGYSFADDHINVAVARWMNQHRSGDLIVIDPAFPPSTGWDPDGFRDRIHWLGTSEEDGNGAPTSPFSLEVIRTGARDAIAKLPRDPIPPDWQTGRRAWAAEPTPDGSGV